MKSLKDRLYRYEVAPPLKSWDAIASSLGEAQPHKSRPITATKKIMYYSVAAAVAFIILCTAVIRFIYPANNINQGSGAEVSKKTQAFPGATALPGTPESQDNPVSQTFAGKSVKKIGAESLTKKYILICNTQGQPVKISAKVASLIISSDNQNPPNPVWDEKVKKWREIMKANTLVPTTINFLDIVELSHTLEMNNP